jgi:predicted nucleic-acid-binding protein
MTTPRELERVEAIFAANNIWVSKTVLLKTNWVLSDSYEFTPRQIVDSFRSLAGLPNVRLEQQDEVGMALDLAEQGFEFADALHMATCGPAEQFVTFDAKLVRRAHKAGLHAVVKA